MSKKQTIRDLKLDGATVLVRVDFNVPQKADGAVADDRRIRSALPTLQYALDHGAALVLVSHLGRPTGKPEEDAKFRMDPVARRLEELIGRPVVKADDVVGPSAQAARANLKPGGIVMLENVRFHPGEKKGDPEFARQLASLADAYVNDAFGTCHRDEASMVAVPSAFPAERRAIGFLVEKELDILQTLLGEPKRPMLAIMGGAKVSDKIQVIENLLAKVDRLLIGGAMTYTFLQAKGHAIGTSRSEPDKLDLARMLMEKAGDKLMLPVDVRVTDSVSPPGTVQTIDGHDLPEGWGGIDIGPKTAAIYADLIKTAGTVVWNGPVGKFEDEPFRDGTLAIARALAESPAITVVGGGETAEAIEQFGLADKVTHVSTGGGAFLESLEGKTFNSLAIIPDLN
ncbi:phosphoglycerate kinase [Isosphaera pallida ATCC 43644]|uniref:Phosphoglycerate kinase n=1 Tax=Isosphaera pallida (strain ATCC 43644 / DSM 9630 / IS1B) TaxID=575540 RepID=E8QXN8_ISOPI|nr:phosphoglycerate kinase [Isosphaera pallida]ADV64075.1 phosphoglycerate kinase [Isosphaera pallida ATCC 43644]